MRAASDRGKALTISEHSIDDLLATARPPADPLEAADRLLLMIRARLGAMNEHVDVTSAHDFPAIFAFGPEEFNFHLKNLLRLEQVQSSPGRGGTSRVSLTLQGWERLRELEKVTVPSDQAFVAMWFDRSMDRVWAEGFSPAIEASGFRPVRIDREEHNDRIDERIIVEIRRSGLLVADYTGHRHGVYFETGLALGLGIPVIWTCREDELENSHFDTRQYNHIAWSDPEDLRERLLTRIRATAGSRR